MQEYTLTLVALCLLVPVADGAVPQDRVRRILDYALPAALAALTAGLIWGATATGLARGPLAWLTMAGLPVVICLGFTRRPVRFGLGVLAIFAVGGALMPDVGRVLHQERTFFGVHQVFVDEAGEYHGLVHGTTLHGKQSLDPARRREPLTYFTPSGPIGQVFTLYGPRAETVAVVGLGAGSLACYAADGGAGWTFYEIDPAVARIARDPRYFTYLADCAPRAPVVLGDARLTLREAPAAAYDLIVLDAFSSDAPPVHLLTREALAVYLAKLEEGGVLAFNISNLYLNLRPVIAALAADAGLVAYARNDRDLSEEELRLGKTPSRWAAIGRSEADLAPLAADPRWERLAPDGGIPVWTDDYSSIVPLLRR